METLESNRVRSLRKWAAALSLLPALFILVIPRFGPVEGFTDRLRDAIVATLATWLGLRGMWRGVDGWRYAALAGFTCGSFALLALVLGPLRR